MSETELSAGSELAEAPGRLCSQRPASLAAVAQFVVTRALPLSAPGVWLSVPSSPGAL